MSLKYLIFAFALVASFSTFVVVEAEQKIEESTVSPISDIALVGDDIKSTTEKPPSAVAEKTQDAIKEVQPNTPLGTVGDFIIQPVLAFRPRPPVTSEDDTPAGKQADSTSSTTAAPWPIFGLGYGQALGSSVTSLAGTITSWLNDRIQMASALDPQQSTTTSSTTSTTARPDVIVRVQHRPSISIGNNRVKKRPSKVDENDVASEEVDDDYEQDEVDFTDGDVANESEDEYDGEEIDEDEEEEAEQSVRPQSQRRPVRKQQNRPQRQPIRKQQIRRPINKRRQQANRFDEDYAEDDSDDDFYYAPQFSTKRSQGQNNFVQLGQQSLLNQIRLLTRGQTPAEIGDAIRKGQPERQQATIFVRRNGQTVYLAPELLTEADLESPPIQVVAQNAAKGQFPQPPLTQPLKINGQTQQYITIPYNQLGILPPESAIDVAEGVQSHPLILSIPQSALKKLQSKEKHESNIITPNAVPLLTEASLADVFKPPQIPPSRTQTVSVQQHKPVSASFTPFVVVTQQGNSKIRAGTIVEKSPSVNLHEEQTYIILNDDNEGETARQVKPAAKNARVVQLTKGDRFALRNGRSVDQTGSPATEQQIPVQIVQDTSESTVVADAEEQTIQVQEETKAKTLPEDEPIVTIAAVPAEAPSVQITDETEVAKLDAVDTQPEQAIETSTQRPDV